ncbi:MAG: hypothetical protein K0Q93_3028 [Nocardioidaceae bacterium]|jgi:DNA-damage-inducible protein D|nr:hypothetical protein [Nocardioidaceae bacterium]
MTDVTLFGASPFDAIAHTDERGECWFARELMPVMGYINWREFKDAIDRAKIAAGNTGADVNSLFGDVPKKVTGGRPAEDFRLTRYAAYLVAMNGDPRKPEIAAAQTYFAVKTREAEMATTVSELDELQVAERYVATLKAKRELELQIAAQAPKVEAFDAYMEADDVFLVGTVAKTLGVKEAVLRRYLRDEGIVMAHPARRNEPYARYVTAGYFEVKSRPVETNHGPIARNTTFVTTKGVEWLRKSLERAGVIEPKPRLALVRSGGVA